MPQVTARKTNVSVNALIISAENARRRNTVCAENIVQSAEETTDSTENSPLTNANFKVSSADSGDSYHIYPFSFCSFSFQMRIPETTPTITPRPNSAAPNFIVVRPAFVLRTQSSIYSRRPGPPSSSPPA